MQGFYLVLTEPHTGQEGDYHNWYNRRHIPDILAVPGVEFARRYALTAQHPDGPFPKFAALYGFSDSVAAVEEIIRRRGTDLLRPSPTVNRVRSRACVFDSKLSAIEALIEEDEIGFAFPATAPLQPTAAGVVAASASEVQASNAPAHWPAIYVYPRGVRHSRSVGDLTNEAAVHLGRSISDVFRA